MTGSWVTLNWLSLHTKISVDYLATNQEVIIVVSRSINGDGLSVSGIFMVFCDVIASLA